MNSSQPATILSVVMGASPLPVCAFTSGVPVQPVRVGTHSDWVVEAAGVYAAHFFLAFDGATVYVALAAPEARLLLHGADVGPEWVPVTTPAELRFGDACITVTEERAWSGTQPLAPPAVHAPQDRGFGRTQVLRPSAQPPAGRLPESEGPVQDGTRAAEVTQGFVAVQPVRRVQSRESGRLMPTEPEAPRASPRFDSTAMYHTPAAAHSAALAQPVSPTYAVPPAGGSGAPAHAGSPIRGAAMVNVAHPMANPPPAVPNTFAATQAAPAADYPAQQYPAPGASGSNVLQPPAGTSTAPIEEESLGPTTLHDGGALRDHAVRVGTSSPSEGRRSADAYVAEAQQLAGGAVPRDVRGDVTVGAPPWAPNAPAAGPAAQSKPTPASAEKSGVGARLASEWRAMSWVKKVSFGLLPFAVYLTFFIDPSPQPAASQAAPRGTSSGAPISSVATRSGAPAPTVIASAASSAPVTNASSAPTMPHAAEGSQSSAPVVVAAAEPVLKANRTLAKSALAGPGASGQARGSALQQSAIEAALQGKRDTAAALYDVLASGPDGRVFALAARLARADAVRKPPISH